ncbi:MAG: 4-hydroxyphenylpyruvate dioxygenase [Zetaproteobacteria bacterium]|nr:4-hydroxyphenylpyruvate dioxygenase [Pseudobdellovibrionaceae bacterium]|tara:strand:+ start:922 stop:1968 length:1047 start_codon:yes stop_codon:yes gene_type:complete
MNKIKNEIGLSGLEFVEFCSADADSLRDLFESFGFTKVASHKKKAVELYRQGNINFILNSDDKSFARSFERSHGPCVSSMAWRFNDVDHAYSLAQKRGAKISLDSSDYTLESGSKIPSAFGIGDSLIYFVNKENKNLYESMGFDFNNSSYIKGKGFTRIDHLTNNVHKGTMKHWSDFYKHVFEFEEVKYFDIRGVKTGLTSYALRSPCGSFSIPINEGTEAKSQINEYLEEYKGPGVQHIAFSTDDIVSSVKSVKKTPIKTLTIDKEYYEEVFDRVKNVTEDHKVLEDLNILVDGDDKGYLLQIFTKNVIGPIFIEMIQRKNHLSFGEGNFGALFRSIEKDQEDRGYL